MSVRLERRLSASAARAVFGPPVKRCATTPPTRRGSMGTAPAKGVEFVNAMRRLRDDSVRTAERETAERWLAWATEQLKAIDPIGELLKDAWPIVPLRAPSSMPWNWE